jgi:hypothetical protein
MTTVFIVPATGLSVPNIDIGPGVFISASGETVELTSYIQSCIDMGDLVISTPAGPAWQDVVLSQANGNRARDTVTIASGQSTILYAGTVLGKIMTGTASASAGSGNAGNGTMGTITVSDGAKAGAYHLVIVEPIANAGTFELFDPCGAYVGKGNVGSAFTAGGLAFTLADGSTDFISGDAFTITVAVGSGKYTALNLTDGHGAAHAAAVLFVQVDARASDQAAEIIARSAEVDGTKLTWPAGITANQQAAAVAELAAFDIIVR